MRLLDTSTLEFNEFLGAAKPPYAILSHTWTGDEVTHDEMLNPGPATRLKAGFEKIKSCCSMAKKHNFSYVWVDSCCIDKRSSAELSEAINSMYRWYREAALCVVYLVDVSPVSTYSLPEAQLEAFKRSRWFSRGWTLQELIAPRDLVFFASDWSRIHFPSANSHDDAPVDLIANITGISPEVLEDRNRLSKLCIAERMSWASRRETTRAEDMAYCLMGIFNVTMPILYGEGTLKAFRRLQDEIMKTSFDYSIFAWPSRYQSSGLLAKTPADFENTPKLGLWRPDRLTPFEMTNLGLFVTLNFEPTTSQQRQNDDFVRAAPQCDVKTDYGWGILLIRLRPVKGVFCVVNGKRCPAYRRIGCSTFDVVDGTTFDGAPYMPILVLEDEHFELVQTANEHHNTRWSENAELEDLGAEDKPVLLPTRFQAFIPRMLEGS
jgi:Heterokaryon incompatibility protein (HET)